MQQKGAMRRLRNAAWKARLGIALAVSLLLAESFALTHKLDYAAHDNGQVCAVCVSAASFGAGAVSMPVQFQPVVTPFFVVVAAGIVFLSVVPTRRYARGPPAASFMF